MSEYIYTESKNVISRNSRISGSKYIILAGLSLIESGAMLRGDRSQDGKPIMSLGKYCILREGCILEPPARQGKNYPQKIASYVYIGRNTKVRAASIGNSCVIGDNCQIGQFVVVKDGAVIPNGTHIPDFAVVSTSSDLPESAPEVIQLYCQTLHAGIEQPVPFL